MVFTIRDLGGKHVQALEKQLQLFDTFLISWTGWEYKTFVHKTGWGQGMFDEDHHSTRTRMVSLYSRPFARAVAGTLTRMQYDDPSGVFEMQWTTSNITCNDQPTEIFLSQKYHYPRGILVESQPAARFEYHNDLLLVFNPEPHVPFLNISLVIRSR